jgi:hypothetical protein
MKLNNCLMLEKKQDDRKKSFIFVLIASYLQVTLIPRIRWPFSER